MAKKMERNDSTSAQGGFLKGMKKSVEKLAKTDFNEKWNIREKEYKVKVTYYYSFELLNSCATLKKGN